MNTAFGKPKVSGWLKIIWDIGLLFSLFIFVTGAAPFIRGDVKLLVEGKPWLHRLAIAAWSGVFLLSVYGADRKGLFQSYLKNFLGSLPLSWRGWTGVAFLGTSTAWAFSSILRHEVLHTSFDMAIFVQAVWNTTKGNCLYSSIKGGICLLADHFSPLLAVLALPYALWPDPRCLLLLQAAAVASSVFGIFAIAKYHLKSEAFAFLFVIAFVLYLPVRNAVRFDFHPELLVIPVFLWAYLCLIQGKKILASLLLLVCLAAKENMALVTFGLGFYAFFFLQARRWGIFWMIFSAGYFFLVTKILIPQLFGQEYFYLSGNYSAWAEYGWKALAAHLFHLSTLSYLFKIFSPLLFLSFFDPAFVLNIPGLAQNLLARNEMARSIFFQYTVPLIPFVFISAIRGFLKLPRTRGSAYCLLTASVLMSGISEYYVIQNHWKKLVPHLDAVEKALAKVPGEASVRTHEFFAPHLANRKEIHIFENDNPREGGSERAQWADYVVLDKVRLGEPSAAVFEDLLGRGYEIFYQNDGVFIFRLMQKRRAGFR